MSPSTEKNQVFGDYAAFLNALLPQAQGFMFHDRHGHLFWHDKAPDTSQLNDEFHSTLNRILANGDLPGETARIPLRENVAYLVRLASDKGKTLGVLTALVDRDVANMPHKFCSDLLKPACRSMERELSLRVHLLDANKRINAQVEQQRFLQEIGELATSGEPCEDSLQMILQRTAEQLALEGAYLYLPAHDIEFSIGSDAADRSAAELMIESWQEMIDESGAHPAEALQNRRSPDPAERVRCWPVFSDGQSLAGAIVLKRGAQQSALSERGCNTARFVTSTIEHLLEKSFDSMTGLSTWPHFELALEKAGQGRFKAASAMYIDMDRMNLLNDTLGRQSGDNLLREFGTLLRQVLGKRPITRVTSDSFAALLLDQTLEQARASGEAICERLQAMEISDNGQTFRPSASVGVAELEQDGGAGGSLLVPAQIACQAAKDRGRGRVEIYIDADKSIVQRLDDLNQVGSIRSAIEGGRLVLFAQPIYNTHGVHDVAYHELLVRMLNTAGEPVPPAEFMGAAERYQLMQELDRWVVTKAIETLTDEPTDRNGKPLRFAVNLSGQSIGSDKFLDFIKGEFQRTGLDPRSICLEITETVVVSNLKKAQAFISELSALGCQFSLDDFGTGLSSFAYLKMFAVNKLKIDGSFVTDVCDNEVSRSMVSAIAEIARVMGIETVAEYVQSQAIFDTISELGVDWAQGYHVGEPARLRDLFENPTVIDKADLADVDPTLIDKLPA